MKSLGYSAAMGSDLLKTLFGVTDEDIGKPTEGDERFFGPFCELQLAFLDDDEPDHLYFSDLAVPLGQVKATKADWDGFMLRMAEEISKRAGKNIRPATQDELRELAEQARMQDLLNSGPFGEA